MEKACLPKAWFSRKQSLINLFQNILLCPSVFVASSSTLDTKTGHKNYALRVLGGESAVPCNPQSAPAGLNSCRRMLISVLSVISGVENQARRNGKLRILSGPEGSSNKQNLLCAVGQLGLSWLLYLIAE